MANWRSLRFPASTDMRHLIFPLADCFDESTQGMSREEPRK
ncbi:hypothetical protein I547_3158 [Mycobacterium kansasii 824]|uniref:Uncharacterized protein n=2 Tax=Mycobacterium kansasii TaxID=1768 RepID=A0A1V3X8W8_MYCKA|nr:hypothetical protein MKAN_12790 [Mycobacterium kansasii ATCC 12478]EUA03215.1 hypothetical protein I547_3158 [Mycobacterium kansasii 824]KEP40677.1 hypothetical protein MKSMC1_41440 [Mycobacterium kansasii]OOK73095.1 hypothetical protein BZL29_5038 [Mycobacterium kansasii]OOK75567.1 hypothetical protein BZL30_3394 [Mycobacterium kansasii]